MREVHVYETPAAKQRVDSLFFSFFLYLGLCVTDCGRRLWGDIIDQFKCCRVFVYPDIFFYCLSFVCYTYLRLL